MKTVRLRVRPLMCFGYAIAITTCSSCSGSDVATHAMPRKIISDTSWQVLARVGGETDDSTLQVASHPVANETGVFVADLAARRVLHFDHLGRKIWTYGRSGAGPEEFRQPRDVRLDSTGRVWVLDPPTGRLTILTPDGQVARQMPIGEVGTAFEVVPLRNGGAILTTPDPDSPFVEIDTAGKIVQRHAFPWAPFSKMSFLATQFVTGSDATTGDWVTAFRLGDSFFSFMPGLFEGSRHMYVEPIAFPKPVVSQTGNTRSTSFAEHPTSAARSVTISPRRFYVLFSGRTEHAARLVDSYSRRTGKYVESYLLPSQATDIEWYDGDLYVLQANPYPELVLLKLPGHRLP